MKKKVLIAATALLALTSFECAKAQSGASLNLDGVDDFIDCGIGVTNALKGKDMLTVEAWVYPTQNTAGASIVGNHQNNTQFNIQQTTANEFNFFIGFGTYGVTTASNSVVLNTWQHIAGVFDDNVLKFYINGVLSGTTAVPNSYVLNPSSTTNMWIGKSSFNEFFQGNVDEVRVWDVARTQCEINTYKNCEIPTTASGLLANYHFNQGIAAGTNSAETTLTDASASVFTGTLTNFALTGTTSNWIAPGGVITGSVTPATLVVGAASSAVCIGSSATLNGTGADTYVWTDGVINGSAFTPTVTHTYTVTGTNTLTTCSNTGVATVTVNQLPVISVSSGTICAGESYTIVATGAVSYTSVPALGSPVVSPTTTTSYSITGTDANGCVTANAEVSTVNVNQLPVISVSSGSICASQSFTFAPTGAVSYTYSSGSAIVSPTTQTSYSVTGTGSNGCVSLPVVSTVFVNVCTPAAALNFDGVDDFVDGGIGVTNALKGKDKLTVEAWVYPTQNTTGTSIVGNHQSNTQFNIQQTTANQFNFFIGFGTYGVTTASNSVVLNTWQHIAGVFDDNVLKFYINGVLFGTTAVPSSYVLNPSCNTNIWIGKSAFAEFFKGNLDEVRVWDVARTQCEINTYKNCEIPTTATGLLANYHFNQGLHGGVNTAETTLTDASASAFTGTLTNLALTGTTSNWVAPGAVITGSVTPASLVVGATVTNSAVCMGSATTLSGTGADTYVWTDGVINGSAFTPTVTHTYTVTGTNTLTTCSNTAVATVTVNQLPVISVSSGTICAGESYTIVATGAVSYTSVPALGSPVVSPTTTTSYSITGTDANGCVTANAAVSTVNVNQLPVIVSETGNVTVCGDATGTFSLVANNTATYSWQYSNAGAPTTIDGTFGETGYTTAVLQIPNLESEGWDTWVIEAVLTSVEGCTVVSSPKLITVNSLPTITVNSGTICAGTSFTMVPTGALSYTYSNGSNVVTPMSSNDYTVTGTDANGCTNIAVSTVSVNALPTLSVVSSSSVLCTGSSATLTASGANTYTWSSTETTSAIAVSPTVQTTYTVTGEDANGCTATTTITQDIDVCTGLTSISTIANDLFVYPNPSRDVFTIKTATDFNVTVMDVLGKVIYTEQLSAGIHTIDLATKANGVYVLKAESNGATATLRLVKN
ncbi:MAG: hypothetical protein K0R26_2418 [Bacteroidota bacterium]|jgi:hypothetical protein|nr:hypothetical protein [Bacteroidota bacterium]